MAYSVTTFSLLTETFILHWNTNQELLIISFTCPDSLLILLLLSPDCSALNCLCTSVSPWGLLLNFYVLLCSCLDKDSLTKQNKTKQNTDVCSVISSTPPENLLFISREFKALFLFWILNLHMWPYFIREAFFYPFFFILSCILMWILSRSWTWQGIQIMIWRCTNKLKLNDTKIIHILFCCSLIYSNYFKLKMFKDTFKEKGHSKWKIF